MRAKKPFKAQYMLLVHMRRHTGEKPHKCTVSKSYYLAFFSHPPPPLPPSLLPLPLSPLFFLLFVLSLPPCLSHNVELSAAFLRQGEWEEGLKCRQRAVCVCEISSQGWCRVSHIDPRYSVIIFIHMMSKHDSLHSDKQTLFGEYSRETAHFTSINWIK